MATSPDQPITETVASLPGQKEYIDALAKYWPDFWRSLRRDVFEKNKELDQPAFIQWYRDHKLKDKWLRTYCWRVLASWYSSDGFVYTGVKIDDFELPAYVPGEALVQTFEPVFEDPFPKPDVSVESFLPHAEAITRLRQLAHLDQLETPQELKQRLNGDFQRQLSSYIKNYKKRVDFYKTTPITAKWVVFFQSGKSIEWIRQNDDDAKTISDTAIQARIKDLADKIGLTRRNRKAGPDARQGGNEKHNP